LKSDQGTAAAGLLEFKLLLEEGKTADAYKEAKDHDQWILKAIQEQIDLVQQGSSDEACYSKQDEHNPDNGHREWCLYGPSRSMQEKAAIQGQLDRLHEFY
jgi:hypothetical protein